MTKNKIFSVKYPGYGSFNICGGSEILRFRAESFLTKEPTTLEWLQSMESDSLLIDVGANIGIYSVPASLFHVSKVVAIEPEIKSYNMLLENLKLNDISSEKCEAIPVAISTQFKDQFTKLYLTADEAGSSCHQVGVNQDFKLRPLECKREYRNIYCISLSRVVQQVCESHDGPIHIKIDVDGIEADVCQSIFSDRLASRISSFQIELNDGIREHHDLIESLGCLGFYFDPVQIKKSRRKEGTFKGFAEYVFRRCMPDKVLLMLPDRIKKRLGSQLDSSFGYKIDNKIEDYFLKDKATKVVQVSRYPAVYVGKSFFDHVKCSNLFHCLSSKLLSTSPQPFNFYAANNGKQNQFLRHKLKYKTIENTVPAYAGDLHSVVLDADFLDMVLKAFMHAAKSVWPTCEDFIHSRSGLQGKKLICRVRHFIDLYGHSLACHHDSRDTVCALVAPIFPYSTATSIVNGSPISRNYLQDVDPQEFSLNQFVPNSYFHAGVKHPRTLSSFTQSIPLNNSSDSDCDWKLDSFPRTYSPLDLRPGECLLIPNLTCDLICDRESDQFLAAKQILSHSGHGILPFVSDIYRPVILIDYLLRSSAELEDLRLNCEDDLIVDYGECMLLFLGSSC